MYIRNALILESGPLADLEIEFDFHDEGTPKPTVIVGRNGAGKSNFLSFVTDALIEIAAKKFTDVAPHHINGSHQWHRKIGGATIRSGSAFELAVLKLAEGEAVHTYLSKGGQLDRAEVQAPLSAYAEAPDWSTEGSVKSVSGPEASIEEIFRRDCYVSFPTGRSEAPYWTSEIENQDNATFSDRFQNLLRKPILAQSKRRHRQFAAHDGIGGKLPSGRQPRAPHDFPKWVL
ncbi:hypothetical protein [Sulfitobacter sp.]|uniref:hypothetical protein n=1 Tax=Sulfitobacter sp. TaxID=1903071 RepID=UPI003F6D7DD3